MELEIVLGAAVVTLEGTRLRRCWLVAAIRVDVVVIVVGITGVIVLPSFR